MRTVGTVVVAMVIAASAVVPAAARATAAERADHRAKLKGIADIDGILDFKVGEDIALDAPIVTLETDKATMDRFVGAAFGAGSPTFSSRTASFSPSTLVLVSNTRNAVSGSVSMATSSTGRATPPSFSSNADAWRPSTGRPSRSKLCPPVTASTRQ